MEPQGPEEGRERLRIGGRERGRLRVLPEEVPEDGLRDGASGPVQERAGDEDLPGVRPDPLLDQPQGAQGQGKDT